MILSYFGNRKSQINIHKDKTDSYNKFHDDNEIAEMRKNTKMLKLQTEESDNDSKADNSDYQKPTLIRDSRHLDSKLKSSNIDNSLIKRNKLSNSKSISNIKKPMINIDSSRSKLDRSIQDEFDNIK